ncbi:ATP-binding protein [Pseudoduganella sp. GCM10020061]|uniref:hybrid sensor histidine kinase/response regulator n=1 Tax=Pseudoduganella sp. GCM10020061 TaxID=3317345 RepID=UPI00363347F3
MKPLKATPTDMPAVVTSNAEAERLRQTTRDLVALTTLPAIWGTLPPTSVIDSLCSVLMKMLDLDLAYVRLPGPDEAGTLEAIRTSDTEAEPHLLAAAREALAGSPAQYGLNAPLAFALPSGEELHATVVRFGITADIGAILVGSARADFPTENERLLLGVAANQATVVLQRHVAEQALTISEQRFLDLADAAPAMLWVTEPDGRCSFLSRGWYAFTGQQKAEGLDFGWINAIHPQERDWARQLFMDANERKVEFALEHRVLHVDGTYRWVIDTGRPRFLPSGEFLGFVGNVLDITDRRAAEQALDETREMLSAVFDALPVGVGVVNQAGELQLSNREMHQYLPTNRMPSMDDERYRRWRFYRADGSLYEKYEFPGARALRGERVVPGMEAVYTRDDGVEIWTQIAAVPLKDAEGAPKGQVSIVTNIDDFKRTEAALREAEAKQRALFDEVARSNKNLSEFLAVLAHELRNPLAPILTGLEMMRIRADHPETIVKVRGIIERQVQQFSHLINDLLDIARVTNGKVDIRKDAVDLKSIVSNAVETSLPLIDKGHHEFTLKLHSAPLPVYADATRIAQVVGNLLTNAAKYTPPGGSISLTVEQDRSQAVISVSDNGIGIPQESLESVFDMFSQVGRNMSHSQGGLGIGLSLVRQLVALHDGTVEAISKGEGKGSTFIVRLPIDFTNAELVQGAGAADGALAVAPRAYRILVADDNVDAATTLSSLLEMYGHELRIAHNGQQALELAAQFEPDVVFLDIGMPDMSGYEVATRLRQMPGVERSVIAAVSGWGAKEDLARARDAGFNMHFTKPVQPSRLSDFLNMLN